MFFVDLSYEKEKKCGCWVGIREKEGRGRPVYLGQRCPRDGTMSLYLFLVRVLLSNMSSGADLGPRTRFLELGELLTFPF